MSHFDIGLFAAVLSEARGDFHLQSICFTELEKLWHDGTRNMATDLGGIVMGGSFAGNSFMNKPVIKFIAMPLARLIVVFAIVVLVIVGAFISHEILKDNLTEDQYIKLFWLAMGSVFFVAGIVFVNLAGKTTNKPKGRSPITQLLLANLGMIVFAGLMFFLFFLQFN